MYSGLKQADHIKGNPAQNNSGLRVAFLQNGIVAAEMSQQESMNRQTIFSSTSGHYYVDGIAVAASETEEALLYRELYEWTDTYY